MKIGIDARLWNQTGVGRYIRNLVTNLQEIDKKNNYVLFVSPDDKTHISKIIDSDKFDFVETDIPWHSISEQIRFPSLLYKSNLDLVHFPYFSIPILYRKPYVMTMHDLIINRVSTGKASTKPTPIYAIKRLAYNVVVLNSIKKASKILVPTHAVKEDLLSFVHIPSEKITVTYEGSTFENIKGSEEISYEQYFLYVGNAYPHKNLERLVMAFSHITKDHPKLKLILVGKEDYFYKRLRKFILKEKLDSSVIVIGQVSDEYLASLYKNAEALVMPSLMEGFGLPCIEAMSMGCPVVSSNIPPLKEVVDEAGIFFDPLTIKDISEKLQGVISMSKTERNTYIKKGLSRVQLFSWKKMSEQTLETYESSISVRSS